MKKFIAYYRVSTKQQGKSGLGLAAQKSTVESFVQSKGIILKEFIEVESGKNNQREQLKMAIGLANKEQSTLVIAKLDRLSRNASFIFQLRDSGVDFVCCDMPDANSLTVGIFASLAQHERELISERTKAGLKAAKAKGVRLGNPKNMNSEVRLAGLNKRQLNKENDLQFQQASFLAKVLNDKGTPKNQIARILNEKGFVTRRGKSFYPATISRMT